MLAPVLSAPPPTRAATLAVLSCPPIPRFYTLSVPPAKPRWSCLPKRAAIDDIQALQGEENTHLVGRAAYKLPMRAELHPIQTYNCCAPAKKTPASHSDCSKTTNTQKRGSAQNPDSNPNNGALALEYVHHRIDEREKDETKWNGKELALDRSIEGSGSGKWSRRIRQRIGSSPIQAPCRLRAQQQQQRPSLRLT